MAKNNNKDITIQLTPMHASSFCDDAYVYVFSSFFLLIPNLPIHDHCLFSFVFFSFDVSQILPHSLPSISEAI